jgi:FKBP-type peptidyl-prolyl cis-trans isomerase (trigger factor)
MSGKKQKSKDLVWIDKNTFQISITLKKEELKKAYDEAIKQIASEIKIDGFRKGKAPKSIVEKNTDKDKIYQEALQKILPKAYLDKIKQHKLKPIINPKFQITSAKEGSDWKVTATAAKKPEVDLSNYKEKIKEINAKGKIWTPGKEKQLDKDSKGDQQDVRKQKEEQIQKILDALLSVIKIEIPAIITEQELNRRMSGLFDQLQNMGLTPQAYAESKGTTIEDIRNNIKKQIEDNYKIEFALEEIAEKEGIKVEKEELDKISKGQPVDQHYLSHLLRQQKTIEYISNL